MQRLRHARAGLLDALQCRALVDVLCGAWRWRARLGLPRGVEPSRSKDGGRGGVGLGAVEAELRGEADTLLGVEHVASLLGVAVAELLEPRVLAHDERLGRQVVLAKGLRAHRAAEEQPSGVLRLPTAHVARVVGARPRAPPGGVLLAHTNAVEVVGRRAQVTPTQPSAET